VEGGKQEKPEKNPRSKDGNQQQTPSTNDTGPEVNSGHIGREASAPPLHHPCNHQGACSLFYREKVGWGRGAGGIWPKEQSVNNTKNICSSEN